MKRGQQDCGEDEAAAGVLAAAVGHASSEVVAAEKLSSTAFVRRFKQCRASARAGDLSFATNLASSAHSAGGVVVARPAEDGDSGNITAAEISAAAALHGLEPPSTWRVRTLPGFPGCVFVANPFTAGGQRDWVRRCLQEYARSENVSNLDAHYTKGQIYDRHASVWDHHSAHRKGTQRRKPEQAQKAGEDEEGDDGDTTQCTCDGTLSTDLIKRLRWVTIGHHYDWTAKVYRKGFFTPFPNNLGALCKFIAKCLGYETFTAEAGIVNFYHAGSTLAGHTDHSEFDLEAPLLSISFGLSAVFLIGGTTRDTDPLPILLQSGDIFVMGGESRLAYHAVPCVLPGTLPACLGRDAEDDEVHGRGQDAAASDHGIAGALSWQHVHEYLLDGRINLNARQVFSPGQGWPEVQEHAK